MDVFALFVLALIFGAGISAASLLPTELGLVPVGVCIAWLVITARRTFRKGSTPDGGRGGLLMLGQLVFILSYCAGIWLK